MELLEQLIDAAPHPSLELLDIPLVEFVQLRAIQRMVDGPNLARLIVQRAQLSRGLQYSVGKHLLAASLEQVRIARD